MKEQYVAMYNGEKDKIFLSNEDPEALRSLVGILQDNLGIKFEFLEEQLHEKVTNVYGFPTHVREAYKS